MNPNLKKALDKELKRERNRIRRIWLFFAIAIFLVLGILTPVFSENIYGETTAIAIKDRSDVSKIQMKVKLESGKRIAILADSNLEHGTGRRVEITRMKSMAGMATYQFVRYVEPEK